jgi:UDP-N-acetylglucosamine 2-epimerase (non-hydrolysing)
MKIITILGTRPEIIKLSPLIPLLDNEFDHKIIHTGQHYSYIMDKLFFDDLKLRDCDYTLNIGSDSHAQQTGKMMIEIEKVLLKEKPDLVLVQGDTNSTLAGALTASKLHIKVAHVEAGCRSFDKLMPEEINRIMVDHCADLLFAPDEIAYRNLIDEGLSRETICLVGNTSIDACLRAIDLYNLDESNKYEKQGYAMVTIHRQENTTLKKLKTLIDSFNKISNKIKVIFPVHLRTRKILKENNIKTNENLILTDPLGYKEFIGLFANSKFIMTDSGGIQEEAAVLNVPCLILRDNTEWMYLVDLGKNVLLGTDEGKIINFVNHLLEDEEILDNMRKIKVPVKIGAAKAIVSVIKNKYKII